MRPWYARRAVLRLRRPHFPHTSVAHKHSAIQRVKLDLESARASWEQQAKRLRQIEESGDGGAPEITGVDKAFEKAKNIFAAVGRRPAGLERLAPPLKTRKSHATERKRDEEQEPPEYLAPRSATRKPYVAERKRDKEQRPSKHHAPPQDLPTPPFLRQKEPSSKFDKWYHTGIYNTTHRYTQKEKQKKAPFATAFAQNPYAQALAAAVREDAFTKARLPRSCLQDFHLYGGEDGEDQIKLLPLGLAAEMVPKKHNRADLDADDIRALNAEEMEQDHMPSGSATYVLAKKEAVDFVGEKPEKRMRSHAIGYRMVSSLNESDAQRKLNFRKDMGDVVLKTMRKVVVKKLRHHMINKEQATNVGVVTAVPEQFPLNHIDELESVGCVLRLKAIDPNAEAPPRQVPEPRKTVRSHFYPNQTSFLGATFGDWDHQTPAEKQAAKKSQQTTPEEDAGGTEEKAAGVSNTQVIFHDHWSKDEARRAPFLGHVQPLPPPAVSPAWFFPTVRWRKQRVPIYNLPYLLGDELETLLKGTNFGDVSRATVESQRGSAPALMWLLKLQAYLAKPKVNTEQM